MSKTVYMPHLNHEVRVNGCRVAHLNVRHPLTMRHVAPHLDTLVVPNQTSFSQTRSEAFDRMLSQVFLNNKLGDCVIAARARRIGLLTGNAKGTPCVYTDQDIITEYERVGGYKPGDPTSDNGCDPTVSADDGVKLGYIDGSKDLGWVAVNASNWHEVMVANFITNGACDLSMALPDAWIGNQTPRMNGDIWDVAGEPNLENGHNVAVVDHDAQKGLLVDTWGLLVWVTPAAVAKYGAQSSNGMLIAHVNRDAIMTSAQRAPNGFDWTTMLGYFDAELGGRVITTEG